LWPMNNACTFQPTYSHVCAHLNIRWSFDWWRVLARWNRRSYSMISEGGFSTLWSLTGVSIRVLTWWYQKTDSQIHDHSLDFWFEVFMQVERDEYWFSSYKRLDW
jgi:hypothetical protein